jgi:ABC-type microcin C transport system permease subunit YejB
MKRLLTITALLVLFACASVAAFGADASPSQTPSEEQNAAKQCKAERGTTAASIEAFAERYGTNKNKKNAFGKCVSQKSKDKDKDEGEDAEDEDEDDSAAARQCRAERGTTAASIEAFAERYGTNKNKKNAFGKCVSQKSSTQG